MVHFVNNAIIIIISIIIIIIDNNVNLRCAKKRVDIA